MAHDAADQNTGRTVVGLFTRRSRCGVGHPRPQARRLQRRTDRRGAAGSRTSSATCSNRPAATAAEGAAAGRAERRAGGRAHRAARLAPDSRGRVRSWWAACSPRRSPARASAPPPAASSARWWAWASPRPMPRTSISGLRSRPHARDGQRRRAHRRGAGHPRPPRHGLRPVGRRALRRSREPSTARRDRSDADTSTTPVSTRSTRRRRHRRTACRFGAPDPASGAAGARDRYAGRERRVPAGPDVRRAGAASGRRLTATHGSAGDGGGRMALAPVVLHRFPATHRGARVKAVRVHATGDAGVLRVEDVPVPAAGPRPGAGPRRGRRPQLRRGLPPHRALQGPAAATLGTEAAGTGRGRRARRRHRARGRPRRLGQRARRLRRVRARGGRAAGADPRPGDHSAGRGRDAPGDHRALPHHARRFRSRAATPAWSMPRPAASASCSRQMAKRRGARVIGTVSTAGEGGARAGGRRGRGHPLHPDRFRDRGEAADRRRGRPRDLRFGGPHDLRQRPQLPASRAAAWCCSARAAVRSSRSIRSFSRRRARCSSPGRRWPTTPRAAPSCSSGPARCSAGWPTARSPCGSGASSPWREAADAQRELEGRRTTGKVLLIP